MTRNMFLASISLAAGLVAVGATGAQATNGYLQHGYGAAAKAMGGISVANPKDTQAVMANPAGLVKLGNRVDAAITLFSPDRDITSTNAPGAGGVPNGVYDSKEQLFLIPDLGINYMLTEQTSVAFTINANGGMNTEYHTNPFTRFCVGGVSCSKPAGVDLSQAFVGLTVAQSYGNHSFGITPTFAVQKFKAYGLEGFTGVSKHPNHVTNQGYDHSVGGGVRIGYLGDMDDYVPGLQVGASYQSRMYMSELSKYRGLFAEGGDFDVPPVVQAGLSFEVPNSDVTLGFDWQWIMYRQVDAVGNDGAMDLNSLAAVAADKKLGGDDHAPGFGWNDQHVFKVGAEWAATDDLTLRVGGSHNTQVYTEHDMLFNILAPATIRTHLTFGGTYDFNANHAVSMAYMRGLEGETGGTHYNHGNGHLNHRMDQHELMINYSYKW